MDLTEIERLHRLGFAIHWLRPKSKIPVRSGWTTARREPWQATKDRYREGCNVGVVLGAVSKMPDGYLAVVDLDVKSEDPKHRREAKEKALDLLPELKDAPKVWSGRGNGSAHYYVRLTQPLTGGETLARSKELVRVKMPSVTPSLKDQEGLPPHKIKAGYRLRAAWEISLMSQGRQVVLPPSIHPDSGQPYRWARPVGKSLTSLPIVTPPQVISTPIAPPPQIPTAIAQGFERVNPLTLGLKPEHLAMLQTGEGVTDRSAALFSVCLALAQRKTPDATILSALTDKALYLGRTAYDHANTPQRDRAARWVERYCLTKAKQTVAENEFAADVFDCVEEWQKKLSFVQGPKGAPLKIKAVYENAILILQNVVGEDLLRRNLFSSEDFWNLDTPWGTLAGEKRSGSNEDALEVKKWAIDQFGVDFPVSVVEEALTWITLQNQFHPVRDFLGSLIWDGTPRVENAFRFYMGANAMPVLYIQAVTRKFFLALMKRIYEPGCKMDSMPVFEGAQGIGKSSFGRILVGEEWFLDGLPDLADKDAALSLQGIWLCEMSELSSLYRSAMESAKAFISRQVDKVRPPYGRRRIDLPRSTVFLGSTNDSEFLIDPSGNRRFWPLSVSQCRFKELARDRMQLLAEARFMYDFAEEPLYFKGALLKVAEKIQDAKRTEDDADAMQAKLAAFLKGPSEGIALDLSQFQLDDLFDVGPWQTFSKNMVTRKSAGRVLRAAGFEKHHTMTGKRWGLPDWK